MYVRNPPEIENEELYNWLKRLAEEIRSPDEITVNTLRVENIITTQITGWIGGNTFLDGPGNRIKVDSIILDGSENEIRIADDIKIDADTETITVGDTDGNYITIDGDNARIRSDNYVAGMAGSGFTLEPDLLEVGNIAARGIIRTAVFQKDVISVVGGYLLVRPGDVLATDMTAADASTLTIEGNETFAVNDMLQIKDGTDNEYMTVTNIASAPTYTVTRDIDGDYGADANPAWKTGATVVNHGPSGEGQIQLKGAGSGAPRISISTHDGTPTWTTRLRLGNLNGFLGVETDIYGFATGSLDSYVRVDSTEGVLIGGDSLNSAISIGSSTWQADGVQLQYNSGNPRFYCGDGSNSYFQFDGTQLQVGVADGTGAISIGGSTWQADGIQLQYNSGNPRFYCGDGNGSFIQFDGTQLTVGAADGTGAISIGGSTWQADGVQLQYNSGNPRFYCGDGSEEYLQFDGSNLSMSTAKSGGGIYVRQGGDIVMEGGASGNPSLLRFKDEAVPGEIRFEQSGDSGNYHKIYKESSNDAFYIEPIDLTTPYFYIGTSSNEYNGIYLYSSSEINFIIGGTSILGVGETWTDVRSHFRPQTDSTYTNGTSTRCWSNIYGDAGVTACSDKRWKTIIGQDPLGLDFINSLSFVEYELNKSGKKRKGKYRGIVAQELEQVLIENNYDPDEFAGLEKNKDEKGDIWMGTIYEQLISPLGRAVQELSQEIENLKQRIN